MITLAAPGPRLRAALPMLVLAGLMAALGLAVPGFASPATLLLVLADTATLFVLAAGLSFVIVIGSIDLGVTATASLAGVVTALLLPGWGGWAFPVALAAGLLAGTVTGLVHVGLRVPSFIASLAAGGVVGGLTLWLSDAQAVTIGQTDRPWLDWVAGETAGLPHIIVVAAGALLLGWGLQRLTPLGRFGLAIGASEPATVASGVRVARYKVLAFALSGLFAALAGIMLAARLTSGSPTGASELLLPSIAAVIVGGTAITGGTGGVARTAVGALTVSVARLGMTFLGVDAFAQQILFGVVLIAAVAITTDRASVVVTK
ncbi:ABC transporter permease [Rubellimicrobium arenae]|uniref:ABC transporter permease n=1 Tax=Rubellimicrobium arenae TaxID=2817372 RepID=UPI001B301007|nr:ABC transporter permease [Rubellimicrobium arenae]